MRIFTTNAVVVYIGSGSGSIAREPRNAEWKLLLLESRVDFEVRVVLMSVCVWLYPPREQRRRSGGSRTTLRAETVQK